AEPFEPFTFSPAGAAVYQLGPVRHGCEETQRMGFEALRCVSGMSRSPIRGRQCRRTKISGTSPVTDDADHRIENAHVSQRFGKYQRDVRRAIKEEKVVQLQK